MSPGGGRERTPLSPSPSPEPAGGQSIQAAPPAAPEEGLSRQDKVEEIDHAEGARRILEEKTRIAIDELMQLATCAAEVQDGDEQIVLHKVNETMLALQALQDATNLPDLTHMIPEDVMGMIDQGRNPDAHTRTFTNRLNSDNQQMRGQANNFDLYYDRLRHKLEQAFPEMQSELDPPDSSHTTNS